MEIIINGTKYVPVTEAPQVKIAETDGLRFCIIRTFSAGVHFGYLKSAEGTVVTLGNARRIWKWVGAFTISEIAVSGVRRPDECIFSVAVPEITLTEAVEIIPCTETARKILEGVEPYGFT